MERFKDADLQKEVDTVLQSTYSPERPLKLKLESGRRVAIIGPDLDFFEQLVALPSADKIELMSISLLDMEEYLTKKKKERVAKITGFFKTKWLDRAFGQPVSFADAYINANSFGINLTDKEILKKQKKGVLSYVEQQLIIDFFENGNEVYQPENN